MREFLELGTTPCNEECAQLGTYGFRERVLKECNVYKRQLQRVVESMGKPVPDGFELRIKSFTHDFGTYYEVVAFYENDEAAELAYELEAVLPESWDEESRKELVT